jgi:HEPN domain-containing protein
MIDELVRKWLIKAMEDFMVAKHELNLPEEEIITSAVCFHCQQLIEKLLKAHLVLDNVKFPKTHDLKFLLDLCYNVDSDFKGLNVGWLTSYAAEIRYTDNFHTPSVGEARDCFEIALNAKDFILRKLDVKEGEI